MHAHLAGEHLRQPSIVIMGRPNVGKSTLFNRLVGKMLAIVYDQPGVTRDWQEAPGRLADLRFMLTDTPGLEGFESTDLRHQIQLQTQKVLEKSDLILFMIDGREGVLPLDKTLAGWVRQSGKPCLLLCNKTEGSKGDTGYYEAHGLGLGDPIALSAAHGQGLDQLYEALLPFFPRTLGATIQDEAKGNLKEGQAEEALKPVRLAILGRPNVGKSTLINKLIGEERLLTSDQPGVTRDSVEIEWCFENQPVILLDTAGVRKKARVDTDLEQLAIQQSFQAVKYAQVVILVIDALSPLDKQELTLASHVIEEGRCLVLALNKWDKADTSRLKDLQLSLNHLLSQVKGIPMIPISALQGKNLKKLIAEAMNLYAQWNRRIPTAKLNMFLEEATQRHPPKLSGPGRIRLKYMTQVKTRPPTFALFASKPSELPESYVRYLVDGIRQAFNLWGVPLRLYLRKGKNPYQDKG